VSVSHRISSPRFRPFRPRRLRVYARARRWEGLSNRPAPGQSTRGRPSRSKVRGRARARLTVSLYDGALSTRTRSAELHGGPGASPDRGASDRDGVRVPHRRSDADARDLWWRSSETCNVVVRTPEARRRPDSARRVPPTSWFPMSGCRTMTAIDRSRDPVLPSRSSAAYRSLLSPPLRPARIERGRSRGSNAQSPKPVDPPGDWANRSFRDGSMDHTPAH